MWTCRAAMLVSKREPVESPAVNLCPWAPFRKGNVDVQGCCVGKQERASGVTGGESMSMGSLIIIIK